MHLFLGAETEAVHFGTLSTGLVELLVAWLVAWVESLWNQEWRQCKTPYSVFSSDYYYISSLLVLLLAFLRCKYKISHQDRLFLTNCTVVNMLSSLLTPDWQNILKWMRPMWGFLLCQSDFKVQCGYNERSYCFWFLFFLIRAHVSSFLFFQFWNFNF